MKSKILIIVIIILALAIAGVVLTFVLIDDEDGNGRNGVNRDGGYKFPDGATFEDKLKICLEKELQVQTCNLIYDDSEESLPLCDNMGELRDKCFYNVAIANNYLESCGRINSAELEEQCNEKIKGGMIFEDE